MIEIHLFSRKRNKYDEGLLVKPMPSPFYDADKNVKAFAELIINTLPGNTYDRFVNMVANRMRELIENDYAKEHLLDRFYIENQIRSVIHDIANEAVKPTIEETKHG